MLSLLLLAINLLASLLLSAEAFTLSTRSSAASHPSHSALGATPTVATVTQAGTTFDLQRVHDAGFPQAYLASPETGEAYNKPDRRITKYDAPIIVIPNFLTEEECDEIMRVGADLESRGVVSDLYLNHRLNNELASAEISAEALALIQEQNLDEEVSEKGYWLCSRSKHSRAQQSTAEHNIAAAWHSRAQQNNERYGVQ
jgi:hypothetical protein